MHVRAQGVHTHARKRARAGGLFELVSCPHYLAEILIYAGLLAASGGQLLPALMLVWVVSLRACARCELAVLAGCRQWSLLGRVIRLRHPNLPYPHHTHTHTHTQRTPAAAAWPLQTVNLALAADATHKWYRRRFKAYPPQRRALIPFVY
jgi:hypothetical protein